jgi:hypothetical protein
MELGYNFYIQISIKQREGYMQGLPYGLVQDYLDEIAEAGERNTQRERNARLQWQNHADELASNLQAASDQLKELGKQRDNLQGELANAHRALAKSLIDSRRERFLNHYIQERLAAGLNGATLDQVREEAENHCAVHLDPVFAKYGPAYDGDVMHGMRVGQGTYIGANYQYIGAWENDLPHGAGMRLWPNGVVEQGDFETGWLVRGERQTPHCSWIGTFTRTDDGNSQLTGLGVLTGRKKNGTVLYQVSGNFLGGRAAGEARIDYFDQSGSVFATLVALFTNGAFQKGGRIETKAGIWYEGSFVTPDDFEKGLRGEGLPYALDSLAPASGKGNTADKLPFRIGFGASAGHLLVVACPDRRIYYFNSKNSATDERLWFKDTFTVYFPNGWEIPIRNGSPDNGTVIFNSKAHGSTDVPAEIYGTHSLPARYGTKSRFFGLGKPLESVSPYLQEETVIEGERYYILHCKNYKKQDFFRLKLKFDLTICELIRD